MRRILPWMLALAMLWPLPSGAQAEGLDGRHALLLVARPGLSDPNFRRSVVLVVQHESGQAAGVIINRPTGHSLASMLSGERFRRFTDPVFYGGPVMNPGMAAVYRADRRIGESINVLSDMYLALEASTLDELMHQPPRQIRFYFGMSGWAPGQLRAEVERGDWFLLDADADTVLTPGPDADGLWRKLVRRARTVTAGIELR